MSGKVNYFEKEQIAPDDYRTIMVCMPVRYVPSIISALETRKTRSFWSTQEDFIRAYEVLNEVQLMLLQGCADEIVNNIIALRGIDPSAARDEIYGVPLAPPQGTSLLDVFATFQGTAGTPGEALGAIAQSTEETAISVREGLGTDGDDLAFLSQLLLLI